MTDSFYGGQRSMSSFGRSSQFTPRQSMAPKKSIISSRKSAWDYEFEPSKRSFGLQTCTDTGVGDCPACLSAKNSCHMDTCTLCCEPKYCGPKGKQCPFAKGTEVQTEPICMYDCLTCDCSDEFGLAGCVFTGPCDLTGVECRCLDKSCSTTGHCLLEDDDELWRGAPKCQGTDPYQEDYADIDITISQQDAFYGNNNPSTTYTFESAGTDPNRGCSMMAPGMASGLDADDIIRKCHALCQTTRDQAPQGGKGPQSTPSRTLQDRIRTRKRVDKKPSSQCPKKCQPSGNETEHYSIIIEEEEGCLSSTNIQIRDRSRRQPQRPRSLYRNQNCNNVCNT